MRSANGRHRRPRQAPALVVAAGVTGSAIAIPLLGATSASAADGSTWDRVAECESSGMWNANHGNGYYGGLQLSEETWRTYGGTAYAPSADLASRSQQIAVAEMVLAAQGPEAWPGCSTIAGLTNDVTGTGVDAGILPSPEQSTPVELILPTEQEPEPVSAEPSTDPSGSAASAGSQTPEQSTAPTAPPAPAESATPDADSTTGKHRGEPAPEKTEPGITDNERETGRHTSRGDGTARDAADGSGADATPGEYTVRAGDSLWAIADARDVPGGWTAIYEANQQTVGADPDLILPGQTLDLELK